MNDANKRQVGGDHYQLETLKGHPQHWDLVVMYDWDYFQAQITKYVMRWKTKHITFEKRHEDLKKALHILEKYIEEAEHYDRKIAGWEATVASNGWSVEGFYGDMTQLYGCPKCRGYFRGTSLGHAIEQHDAKNACSTPS